MHNCRLIIEFLVWDGVLRFAFGCHGGVERRASNSVSSFACETRASSSMSEYWSGTATRALSLGIAMVLRYELRALRFVFTRVALISLASETWTLLSDDLSSVIFRHSREPPQKFLKLYGRLGRISKHFGLSIWQQALKTELTVFWDTLSLILPGF